MYLIRFSCFLQATHEGAWSDIHYSHFRDQDNREFSIKGQIPCPKENRFTDPSPALEEDGLPRGLRIRTGRFAHILVYKLLGRVARTLVGAGKNDPRWHDPFLL